MTSALSPAERLKFRLLAEGMAVSTEAAEHLAEVNQGRAMTPADYASTSGLIVSLPDDVWVNAPVSRHNPNFVHAPHHRLVMSDGELAIRGGDEDVPARVWLPPSYHGGVNAQNEPYNSYGFTHADRVRVSPVEGCAMTCKFCDLPYEFRYRTKRIDGLVDTVHRAMDDPVQPARHVLISGGTPRTTDIGYLNDCYDRVLSCLPGVSVDVMMVPSSDLLDVERLARTGVDAISANVEIVDRDLARRIMPRKHDQGLENQLDFLEHAAAVLGPGRVRSMLMVGLEPRASTLAGVAAMAERGVVPVLSPFRPDPSTPLRDWPPPDASEMEQVYLAARDICHEFDVPLGPPCIPCSHNTLTLAVAGAGDAHIHHGTINLV